MGNSIYRTTNDVNTNMKRKYGWKPDLPDKRDLYHSFNTNIIVPKNCDLRPGMPPIYDQGHLGSCTANAVAAAYEYDEIRQNETDIFTPSRLFIYYNERKMEGTVPYDSGATIRDSIKTIYNDGVVSEEMWPYNIENFTTEPSVECYENAKLHKCVSYKRVEQDFTDLQECLTLGLPVVFGMTVYESFESQTVQETGIMPMPKKGEKILGGHALCLCGIDTIKERFIVRNSWGENWGDKGYFYMPYEYLLDEQYCRDFWTVLKVQDDTF